MSEIAASVDDEDCRGDAGGDQLQALEMAQIERSASEEEHDAVRIVLFILSSVLTSDSRTLPRSKSRMNPKHPPRSITNQNLKESSHQLPY
jgi:hypothetical protein